MLSWGINGKCILNDSYLSHAVIPFGGFVIMYMSWDFDKRFIVSTAPGNGNSEVKNPFCLNNSLPSSPMTSLRFHSFISSGFKFLLYL